MYAVIFIKMLCNESLIQAGKRMDFLHFRSLDVYVFLKISFIGPGALSGLMRDLGLLKMI